MAAVSADAQDCMTKFEKFPLQSADRPILAALLAHG
jgi:hypothetical protein